MIQLNKLFDIKEGEGKPTTLLFAYFFFFGATLTVGKTARNAYFLNRYDIEYLPLMFLAAATAVAIVGIINYFISKRLDLIQNLFRTISISGFIFAISLIFIQISLEGLLIPFLYVWIDVITIVINFQFVIYVSMIFNSQQAKRLFAIILCGSPIARILIGASIPLFVGQFGSDYLLTLTSGFILCCVLMAWIARPYMHHEQLPQKDQNKPSKTSGLLDNYFKMLALAIGAAAVATVIIEYQFLIFSKHFYPLEEELAGFFGKFYSITGFVSLFTQLLLTKWILTRFGILAAMRILPAGLGIGALAILFNPSLLSALIGRASEQITKFTLNKTSFELLWVPVSPDQKQRKRLFIDDTIKTSMQGLTGIFIYVLIKVWPMPYLYLMQILSLMALVSIGIWLFTTSHLKKGYVSALASAIEKRQLNFEELQLDTTDSEIVKTIEDALNSDEEAKQIFALELISDLNLAPWSNTLKKLFKKGLPSVREKVLAMTADHPDILSDTELQNTIERKGLLARDAIIISGKRNMAGLIPAYERMLENTRDENAEIRAAAATAVLMMNKGPRDAARSTLEGLLTNEDENLKAVSLRMLRHIPDFLTDNQLQECCVSNSTRVCSAALQVAHLRYDVSLIPCIISCLKHPQTRSVAGNVLKAYPAEAVTNILNKMLMENETDRDLTLGIIRIMKDYWNSLSISILVQLLKNPSLHIKSACIITLLRIARKSPLSNEILQQLNGESRIIAKQIYTRYQMMEFIVIGAEGMLLYDLYKSEAEQLITLLLKLLILQVPEVSIESYIRKEKYDYRAQTDNLIEIFENILPRRESEYIIPLFKNISIEDRRRTGRKYFPDLPNELDPDLIQLIQSSEECHRIIGLAYAISQSRSKVLKGIDWSIFIDNKIYDEIISKYVARNNNALMNLPQFPQQNFQKSEKELQMLSMLERMIILKGTNLFEGIPGESIYNIALVLEEERLEKGTLLFERGDKGAYFYIIVTGEVLIHIDETEFTRHRKGEYFGEMALLDDHPRSASATALEETLLLKIDQENFLDIMMDSKDVRRSIMRILNDRIRRLTDQYARATS